MGALLEVCVDSVPSLKAAIRGGASRIELCSSLSEGGLTPSYGFIQLAKQISPIPIYVLVRPRSGNFSYSVEEKQIILNDIGIAKKLGVDGIVCGFLQPNYEIDFNTTAKAVKEASPLPFTFHRAFDVSINPINDVINNFRKIGVSRILTSGRKAKAIDGKLIIEELVKLAGDKITILAGSGISLENAAEIMKYTGVKELHASCKSPYLQKNEVNIKMGSQDATEVHWQTDVEKVKSLKKMIDNL